MHLCLCIYDFRFVECIIMLGRNHYAIHIIECIYMIPWCTRPLLHLQLPILFHALCIYAFKIRHYLIFQIKIKIVFKETDIVGLCWISVDLCCVLLYIWMIRGQKYVHFHDILLRHI